MDVHAGFSNQPTNHTRPSRADPGGGGLAFAAAAEEYQALMLFHMDKESGMLFAAADIRLSKETDRDLSAAFARLERERIGDGVHQRLHAAFDQLRTLYLG